MEVSVTEKKMIDAYPALVAILDREGNILCVNREWQGRTTEANGFFGREYSVGNYFDYLARAAENGNDFALKIILGIRQVIEGEPDFHITYPVINSSNQKNWYKVTVRPADDKLDTFLLIHEDVSRLIQTTVALRESQERYKQQFMEADMPILIGKPDGDILDANPAALDLLGYTKEELLKIHRNEVIDISSAQSREAVEQHAETGEFQGELPMIDKYGKRIPVELSSKIYRNETGHLRTLTMFKDISARKEVEEKFETEKRFNETALDSLPGLFVLLDEQSQIIRFNNGFTVELGYDDPADLDKSIFDIIVPEDHQNVIEALTEVREHGKGEVQATLVKKNGDRRIYKFRGNRFNSKDEVYIAATGIDITENIEIEREKEFTYELMAQLFNNSPIGIVLSDTENKAERVNDQFTRMFGFQSPEILGNSVDELISPSELREDAERINEQVLNGKATQQETVRRRKDGSELPVLLGTVPVKMAGKVVAVYGIYIDISERIELEVRISELFEKEKKARKEAEKSKLKLEKMFAQSPTGIALLEGDQFKFIMANSAYHKLIGGREIIGRNFDDVLPEMKSQGISETLRKVYDSGESYVAEEERVEVVDSNGQLAEHFLNYTCKPLFDDDGHIYGIFVEAVDVTELVNSRNKIQNSLKEKEILLQEVHHRVKNNLAVITGLMDLQMMDTPDDILNPKLREVQSRIFSIAQIHEAIYQQEDVVRVKFDEYLKQMVDSWKQNSEHRDIRLDVKLDNVSLNLNQAVSCGLLTNELMNLIDSSGNGKQNHFSLSLVQKEDLIVIGFENRNFGVSSVEEIEQAEKFNLKIIQVLLSQLSASYHFEEGEAKKLIIQFQKVDVKGSSSSFI